MTKEIQVLYEEMEKVLNRTLTDFMNCLIESSGNLKDIANGTHIKIPTDAGYVSWFKSVGACTMKLWLSETITETRTKEQMNSMTDADITDFND